MFATLREQETGDLEQHLSGLERLLCRHEVEFPTPVFKGNTARHAHNPDLVPEYPHTQSMLHTHALMHTQKGNSKL